MPPSWRTCFTFLAWAVGGEGEMFPENVGFPIGENNASYIMMEMHYDNPQMRAGVVDSSGIRLFYTDQLRQYDAATLGVGSNVSPFHVIPPRQQYWLSSGYCDSSCTREQIPPGGIKVFQGLLHSHQVGVSIILRHGRDGQELPPIMSDMSYDFDYQNTRVLKEERTILPGDSLFIECGYDTSYRSETTFGGFGTRDEMCLAFLSYYPRIELSMCGSNPHVDTLLDALGIEKAINIKKLENALTLSNAIDVEAEKKLMDKLMSGNVSNEATPFVMSHLLFSINITAPQKYFNRSLYSVLNDKNTWMDEGVLKKLQKAVLENNHTTLCYLPNIGMSEKSGIIITAPKLKALPMSLPKVNFMHKVILDQQSSYTLLWTPRKDDIVFEVQVGTTGYVGLGFSPSGGMKGADIIMGWVKDSGEVILQDRYAEGNSAPLLDEVQDVKLLGGYQNDTHTVFRFSRSWNTCDKKQDYVLGDDTVHIIWAYSDRDPVNEAQVHYHQRRGTKTLYLQSPNFRLPTMGPDVKTWDLLSPNVSIPDHLDTLYWCSLFKVPSTSVKHHIIGFVPKIEEKNQEHLHHFLLYECHLPDSETHMEPWLASGGAQCYSANMPPSWNKCTSIIMGWAVGGEGEMFPDHTGFPMGEKYGGANYLMLEVHYDNPNMRTGVVDSSGMTIFYTDKLRQYDAGLLTLGHAVLPLQIVPPRQENFISSGFCDGSCTDQFLPKNGIKVFQSILHSHLLGRRILMRQIREGKELPLVVKDMNYDFNYQNTRIMKEEMTILPSDTLIAECHYSSSHLNMPTFGGLETKDEMCLIFLGYYPRANLSTCASTSQQKDTFAAVGIEKIIEGTEIKMSNIDNLLSKPNTKTKTNKLERSKLAHLYTKIKVEAPPKYFNMSVYEVMHKDATWQSPIVSDSLQRVATSGVHISICEIRGSGVNRIKKLTSYPAFRSHRQQPDQCSLQKDENMWGVSNLCPSSFPFCRGIKTKDTLL